MWGRLTVFGLTLVAVACATDPGISYRITPSGTGQYALKLTTLDLGRDRHQAEIEGRAKGTCSGAYTLTDEQQEVRLCTDDCDLPIRITTTATLSCEKKAA